ncbi:MAG: hypothetical protein V7603_1582 [Micromonosporaceae bacterium]
MNTPHRPYRTSGRSPEPSAAIRDAQTVKTSGNVPEHSQGIDAGKKIKGRKRHVATDVLDLLLVVLVTAASVQDTTGGRGVVEQVARQHPMVAVAWADSGYKQSGKRPPDRADRLGTGICFRAPPAAPRTLLLVPGSPAAC